MTFDLKAALDRLAETQRRIDELETEESRTGDSGAKGGPSREELSIVLQEQLDEIQDALHPEEALVNRIPPPERESDILADDSGGLAIMVGHSARSPGYAGASPPFSGDERHEYWWNKDLALRIRQYAQSRGIRCEVFTRDGKDVAGSYDAVRAWKPTATVELHFNAVARPAEKADVKGSLVLYGADASRRWAQMLLDVIVDLYDRRGPRENLGIHIPGPNNGYSRGQANVTQVFPSALIEPFFGHNPNEGQMAIDRKQALAERIVSAYASFAGAPLTVSEAAPGSGASAAVSGNPIVSPRLEAAAAAIQTPEFRELWSTYQSTPLDLPGLPAEVAEGLKLITLAQWAEESSWGKSELARQHRNYAGMKALSEVARVIAEAPATKVVYQAHDGSDIYLRFAAIKNFIKGYWLFVERSPYAGWRESAREPAAFIRHLASHGWAQKGGYAERVIVIADTLRELGVGNSDGGLNPLPSPVPSPGATPTIPASPAGGASTGFETTQSLLNLSALPPQTTTEFRTLFLETSLPVDLKPLIPVLAAQWGIESAWGASELARLHYNFAGVPWVDFMGDLAVRVPHPTRPEKGDFCRFLTQQKFVDGYVRYLDQANALTAWRQHIASADEFIEFLARGYRPEDPGYGAAVRRRYPGLVAPAAPTPVSHASNGPAPKPVAPASQDGRIVVRIERIRSERRRGAAYDRTVSRYDVLLDGQPIDGASGMAVERQGPGDNSLEGRRNARRIAAGVYSLYTQHGSRQRNGVTMYKTRGYTDDTSVGAVPRPSLRLGGTGSREGILIHPAQNYVWSVGCINLSQPFDDVTYKLDWQDSRDRVIALIDLLKKTLGDRFPDAQNQLIENAVVKIVGEPGPARGSDIAVADAAISASGRQRVFAEAEMASARDILATDDTIRKASEAELFGALAASMQSSAELRMVEPGLIERAIVKGIDIKNLRGRSGENLWVPWVTAWRSATAISEQDVRAPVIAQLDHIAALLKEQGVDVNDKAGRLSPMGWAATLDSPGAINRLRELDAAVDAYDGGGMTPLHRAAHEGAREAVARLLALGANPQLKTKEPNISPDDEDVFDVGNTPGSDAIDCARQGRDFEPLDPDRLFDYESVIALLSARSR